MGLIIALCALVGGWHYVRLWIDYGNPLIGNWDPKLFSWWQEDGFRTSTFYLQFGDVLFHPWSGVSAEFLRRYLRHALGRRTVGLCSGLFFAPALEL